uniref:RRM domain-containing protein n=1 Tax=Neobodo designis TaxID=312471 RepID=A0A7S1Q6D1_NEODS|eukprot:CAMPEP_0174841254 /NCGR_PEP_ID=MMETSP1114-20130205/9193_1 /TAXON_ID=312471 /ORGANISM="Neobodo designis, Strain CCAP 1951/1" /LENGTH=279 /DNA_ID=CAMNT_0016075435 /DNA_START=36 /DNA_END=875 /DNA_ORIENTATION=+
MPSNAWADVSNSNPSSPTSPTEPKKKLVKRMVERPATMVDVRKRTWKKFGDAAEGNKDITAKEKPVFLELGNVDPLEKACNDEVLTMLHNSANLRVEVPLTAHLQKLKRELMEKGGKTGAAAAAAATAGSPGASPAGSPTGGAPMTWAERQKMRKNDPKAAAGGPGAAGAAPGGPRKDFERNTVRVSNLVDTISQAELTRIFGPENGLGQIMRFYQPRFRDGGPKHFCYISYRTAKEADEAVAKNNRIAFKNVVLLVDYGTDRGAAPGGAGAPGGPRRF